MLLRQMVQTCFAEIGVDADPAKVQAVEMALRLSFGGSRVYVPAWPKARARQLAEQAGNDTKKLVALAGITPRHARRVLHGR